VPVKAARARVFGVPLWVAVVVALALVWKACGSWVALGSLLGLAAAAIAVGVLLIRTPTMPPLEATSVVAVPDLGAMVGAGEYAALAGVVCVGCRQRPAVSRLAVLGHELPVCEPCDRTAADRIIAGIFPGTPLSDWALPPAAATRPARRTS
jgi:hypothetical protein